MSPQRAQRQPATAEEPPATHGGPNPLTATNNVPDASLSLLLNIVSRFLLFPFSYPKTNTNDIFTLH
tara:strand:+ start:123 stop:323 length:201 start_codon:yes stop_codon:yes gene_type:complete